MPNAYLSGQLTKDLFLGVGYFGAVRAGYRIRSLNGPSTGLLGAMLQAIKSEIKTININPSIAYRVSDKVSLGFGLNYQTIDAELTKFKLGAIGSRADDSAWGWNAGALFTLSPAMRVGFSYRSCDQLHAREGECFNGALSADQSADMKLAGYFYSVGLAAGFRPLGSDGRSLLHSLEFAGQGAEYSETAVADRC